MAFDYRVIEITYEDVSELETALDTEGASDWELIDTYPGPINAETGEAKLTAIFKKTI